MADHQDRLSVGIGLKHLAEFIEGPFGPQAVLKLQLALVANLIAYERSRLRCPLERTTDYVIHLRPYCSQGAPHEPALTNAVFIQAARCVFLGVRFVLTSAGVSEEINDHLFRSCNRAQ